jgi:hypothetical protein
MKTIAENHNGNDSLRAIRELEYDNWQELSATYLPVDFGDSIWKYSRPSKDDDPDQGWKLHVSATMLSANKIFEIVAPYLRGRGVLFKAPRSLKELETLNSGLQYGYSQVGKFITVYPRSDREARSLAQRLDRLTRGQPAPAVPFDFRFSADSCVFYRYGAFEPLEVDGPNGTRLPAVRNPSGKLVADARYSETARPEWVPPLFADKESFENTTNVSPLQTTFRAFESLAQRGKGGVYKAVDFSQNPPRLCLLKEGRNHGEAYWDSRDGSWLVRHEEEVLRSLARAGVPVPAVYDSFELNRNQYLVTEFVQGETLYDLLKNRQRRLRIERALAYSIQLASLLARIHAAGWAWRDCKPQNLLVTDDKLRPIDFEGACDVGSSDSIPWSTFAFTPVGSAAASGRLADIYALGMVTYFLLAGTLPESPDPIPLKKLRPKVPECVCQLVHQLLLPEPRSEAGDVLQQLSAVVTWKDAGTARRKF